MRIASAGDAGGCCKSTAGVAGTREKDGSLHTVHSIGALSPKIPKLQVTHYPADLSAKPEIIVNAGYDTVLKTSRPQRQKLEVPINIRPGDQLDFVVDPRNNHDCDGLYIVEAKIWPPVENERTKKRRLLV